MPDSSLRVRLCSFFYHHSDSDSRSRMTAGGAFCFAMTFCPVYANMPLSPRKARHFPPSSGEADAKEKIIKFYKSINWSNEYTKNRIGNASRSCIFYIKGKRAKCKPSPLVGEGGGVSRRKG